MGRVLSFASMVTAPSQGDRIEVDDQLFVVAGRVWRADGTIDCHLHPATTEYDHPST